MTDGVQKYLDYIREHGLVDTSERRDLWRVAWNQALDWMTQHATEAIKRALEQHP